MIKVITAPEMVDFSPNSIKVFLAGGIQKCPMWQERVIKHFTSIEMKSNIDIYLMNPRRPNFPINDPSAAEKIPLPPAARSALHASRWPSTPAPSEESLRRSVRRLLNRIG